jgi:16S rRNA (guanine966-N2)-methyltransferase
VIGGSARGIRLVAPGHGTRPLTDRVKQSLFGAFVADGTVGPGTAFLDLFAGSGAAGIEALSRGAERAVLVERDGGTCDVIGENLRRAKVSGGHVVRSSVASFLSSDPVRHGAPFDACLADPPYGDEVLLDALDQLGDAARGWLAPGALVAAKHFWREQLPDATGALERERQKRFGETALTFYRYRP